MGSKSSKISDNGQQVCKKKSKIVNVTIENESETAIIVFDAEAEAEVEVPNGKDKVDDARRRKEVQVCRQPHEILAHSTITLQRKVGASFRFWTEKGMMAFAMFADDWEDNQQVMKTRMHGRRLHGRLIHYTSYHNLVSNQTPVS